MYSLERLRAEARRRRIEQLVLDSPDGVLVTNIVGTVLFANAAAEQLFGKPQSAIVGQSLGFTFEDGQTFEIEIMRGDERRAAEVRAVACRWQDVDAFLATIRDVAASGVDFISVGALTHSAPVADLSLRML